MRKPYMRGLGLLPVWINMTYNAIQGFCGAIWYVNELNGIKKTEDSQIGTL